jgi:hypothetical protein
MRGRRGATRTRLESDKQDDGGQPDVVRWWEARVDGLGKMGRLGRGHKPGRHRVEKKVKRYDGGCRCILRALDRLAMQGQVDTGWMLVFMPGRLGRWMIVMTGGIRVFDRCVAGCTVVLTQDMGYNIHGKVSLFANAQPKLGPGGNIGPEQDHKGRRQGGYAYGPWLAHEDNVPD